MVSADQNQVAITWMEVEMEELVLQALVSLLKQTGNLLN